MTNNEHKKRCNIFCFLLHCPLLCASLIVVASTPENFLTERSKVVVPNAVKRECSVVLCLSGVLSITERCCQAHGITVSPLAITGLRG